jgi:hypothetical protein
MKLPEIIYAQGKPGEILVSDKNGIPRWVMADSSGKRKLINKQKISNLSALMWAETHLGLH